MAKATHIASLCSCCSESLTSWVITRWDWGEELSQHRLDTCNTQMVVGIAVQRLWNGVSWHVERPPPSLHNVQIVGSFNRLNVVLLAAIAHTDGTTYECNSEIEWINLTLKWLVWGCIDEDVRGNVGTVHVGVPGLVSDFDGFAVLFWIATQIHQLQQISFGSYGLSFSISPFSCLNFGLQTTLVNHSVLYLWHWCHAPAFCAMKWIVVNLLH
jgi:hypothetical protein